jgi:SET domain-containing protein 6
LIVSLMVEAAAGSASEWSPFIGVLPQPGEMTETPLFWNDDELRELEGTDVLEQLGRAEIRETFDRHVVPLVLHNPKAFGCPPMAVGNGDLDEREKRRLHELFVHWGSVAMSRGFDSHPTHCGPVMTPMADMLNHRTGRCNAHLENHCHHHGGAGARFLTMVAVSRVGDGDELINTYGDLGNGELLRRYGFTDDDNPFDTVSIKAELLADGGTVAKRRIKRMIANGEVPASGFEIGRNAVIPRSMKRAAAAVACEMATAKTGGCRQQPIEMTAKMWKIIETAVVKRLSQYPTTLDGDVSALTSLTASDRFGDDEPAMDPTSKVNALRVRIGEKTILSKLLTKCKRSLIS